MKTLTTTSDERDLLTAIIQQPEEDTPRLAYADLLDEIGGEANHDRAAFIRLRCRLARWAGRGRPPTGRREEARLLRLYAARWSAEVTLRPTECEFVRGFVGRVLLTPRAFAAHANCLPCGPVTAVKFLLDHKPVRPWAQGNGLKLALNKPCFARITDLDLSDTNSTDADIKALATAPHVGRIEVLSLARNPALSGGGVADVIASPAFAGLRRLDLSNCGTHAIPEAGIEPEVPGLLAEDVARIARAGQPGRVVQLNLAINDLGGDGLVAVARGLWRPQTLVYAGNWAGDEAVANLAMSPNMDGLAVLDLNLNSVGDAGAIALADSPLLRRVEVLILRNNEVGDRGARALAQSPHLTNLRWLALANNHGIGKSAADDLRRRFGRRVELPG